MGIFTRFTDIVNANINSMLDKAEQPEKMVTLIIQEMQETLVEVRSTAAKHIAEKKTVTRQLGSLKASMAHWQNKAEIALSKDREDLAKSALEQKHQNSAKADNLNTELSQIDELLSVVQSDGQRLQDKLSEAKQRQQAYVMRQQTAVVRLKVREKEQNYDIDQAIGKFERYQQKIDSIEAEVEAFDMTSNKDLSGQIGSLVANDDIDRELAQLKKQAANH
jgi:phage shock protein A